MGFGLTVRSWLNIAESSESLMLKYADTSDVKYLNELIKRIGDDLFHYLLSQIAADLAHDIYQITWEKVIKRRKSYSDTGSFKAWVFKIARFSLVDEYRRVGRWHCIEFDELADQQSTHVDILMMEQDMKSFDEALNALPFLQREVFILQQEGLRLREISNITQTEMETVKSRLRYAKSTLKQKLLLEDKVSLDDKLSLEDRETVK
ncbi:sigma-70 family RNA polymerase sigma factor [uncultured Psychrosphaera sp.]|uniref:sigma-70 family RNA polymerase sigma factor n=1 Tax=uncultured Psychrosphaera sp. TaxID=1403522 RepID=UPI002631B64A|nr:sigma-70 family RNA polymerase sigma factor [uncultured Psychrosphaera sp.]